MKLKRFRVTDTGTKLVVRLALQTDDTLAQSDGWLEAKIELDQKWASEKLPNIRAEALRQLQAAISDEIRRTPNP
jgi:hypothetical protein